MANETVTQLSATTTLADTDLIYVVAGGNSRKMTWAAFRAEFLNDSGVEANADVTDTANVTAAGALMDSEVDADIKTLVLPANTTISAFGATLVDDADAATARTTLGAEAADADILKADTSDEITTGFSQASHPGGVLTTGTYTPVETNSNFHHITNNSTSGGITIGVPVNNATHIVELTNNATGSLIAPALSGSFNTTDGDAFTTTNSHRFLIFITKSENGSHATVKALQ